MAYLRVTGTLYLAQLIHACQNDLHSNNLLGSMILCLYMYIYNKITVWLVILSLDCTTTISIQRRPACPLPESSVSQIWQYRGAACLDDIYSYILAISGLKFLQVVYIGTQSFILTASYTVLPKLKRKNGIYCSIDLRLLMTRGRREACLYRRS